MSVSYARMYIRMYVCMYVYVQAMCVPSASGGQKRVLHLLEQELQMTMSHHVGVENCTQF